MWGLEDVGIRGGITGELEDGKGFYISNNRLA
jgi:hypothetical protein